MVLFESFFVKLITLWHFKAVLAWSIFHAKVSTEHLSWSLSVPCKWVVIKYCCSVLPQRTGARFSSGQASANWSLSCGVLPAWADCRLHSSTLHWVYYAFSKTRVAKLHNLNVCHDGNLTVCLTTLWKWRTDAVTSWMDWARLNKPTQMIAFLSWAISLSLNFGFVRGSLLMQRFHCLLFYSPEMWRILAQKTLTKVWCEIFPKSLLLDLCQRMRKSALLFPVVFPDPDENCKSTNLVRVPFRYFFLLHAIRWPYSQRCEVLVKNWWVCVDTASLNCIKNNSLVW